MTKPSSPKTPDPTYSSFQKPDLEAMMAMQMRNISAVRHMANLVFDSAEEINRRQIELLKTGALHLNTAYEDGENEADAETVFKRQVEAQRELVDSLTTHVSAVADIASKCCSGLIRETAENIVEPAVAACCQGKAKKDDSKTAEASQAKK